MENILPFVIGAIVLIARIYNNFQKEQEKARKRNPSQRPVGEKAPDFEQRQQKTKHSQVREVSDPFLPAPGSIPEAYEAYSGALQEVEEVRRAREIHNKHKHGFSRLEPYRQAETVTLDRSLSSSDFDLRDAVIKSAILHRPYID